MLLLAAAASLLSCGRDVTGPGLRGPSATVAFAPSFEATETTIGGESYNVASLVPFEKVRVVLRRGTEVVADRLVDFPSSADSVALQLSLNLSPDAGPEGEVLAATLQYINAQGDTVFSGGPISVLLAPGRNNEPVEIPVVPVGPGSEATRVVIAPDTVIANSGSTVSFTATAFDGQGNVVPNAPIGFISSDPARVLVPQLGVGSAQLVGARGDAEVYAMVLSGATDTALVRITPIPASLVKVAGDTQQALSGEAFASPLRVRVLASDAQPLVGWPVTFAVTTGSGSLSANIVDTDANGEAEVVWTAGANAGAASVTASIDSPPLSVTFTGTQLQSGVATLVVTTQPASVVAGANIGPVVVEARNGLDQLVTDFVGQVDVALTGAPQGTTLLGETSVAAVAGVATFANLSVDRAGSGFRLAFSTPGVGTAISAAFTSAPPPPAQIVLLGGGSQSAPEGTALADSIRIRVLDDFGQPSPDVTVTFTVQAGGGSVLPQSAVTDADGRASTRWTLGAAGAQSLEVSVPQVPPLTVTATAVGGTGTPVLFAGSDALALALGQTVQVPIFLSEPAATPVTVTLTSSNGNIRWGVPSVDIPAGVTTVQVPLTADSLGTATAFLASSAGNDSIVVTVTQASLFLADVFNNFLLTGDTLRTGVKLSDPAPPGGVSVTIRVADPLLLQVAPTNGVGSPAGACVQPGFCFQDLRTDAPADAESTLAQVLTAPPGDTAVVVVPEGQLWGHFALIGISDQGQGGASVTTVRAEAAAYVPSERIFSVEVPELFVNGISAFLGDTIGVGQYVEAIAVTNVPALGEPRRIRITSRNPAIVRVDSIAFVDRLSSVSGPLKLRGESPGTTWVVAEMPGIVTDSLQVTVAPPRLRAFATPLFGRIGQAISVTPAVAGSLTSDNGYRSSPLPFTLRVSPAGIVELESATGVLGVGPADAVVGGRYLATGSAYIVVEAAGHAPDSVLVTGSAGTVSLGSGPNELGVGLRHAFTLNLSAGPLTPLAIPVSVTSSNPAVVRVLTPSLELGAGAFSVPLALEGVAEGTATITVSGAGLNTSNFALSVTPARLVLSNVPASVAADSTFPQIVTGLTASASANRAPADTVRAILRSSDPAVLRVTDSVMVFHPGAAGSFDFAQVLPLQPGNARLTLSADGFTTSDSVTVTVRPFALQTSGINGAVGLEMQQEIWVFREGPSNVELPLSAVSVSGRTSVTLEAPSIPDGSTSLRATVAGLAVGEDTIVFTAAGYAPDTLVLSVAGVTALVNGIDEGAEVGAIFDFIGAVIFDTLTSSFQAPAADRRFLLRSSDTTIARPAGDTITIAAGQIFPIAFASVQFLNAGTVALTLEDLDGAIPSDTTVVMVQPATLHGGAYPTGQTVSLGTGQRTYSGEVMLIRPFGDPSPLTVRLNNSNPSAATVPDSVVFAPGVDFLPLEIIAGDSVGSTRIVASATGYADFAIDVIVSRARFEFALFSGVVGARAEGFGYVVDDQSRFARPVNTDIPVRFVPLDTDVADGNIGPFTWPALDVSLQFRGPVGVGVGVTDVRLEDLRPPSVATVLPGLAEMRVSPRGVRIRSPRLSVPLGARTINGRYTAEYDAAADTVLLRLQSLGGRVQVTPDSLPQDAPVFGNRSFPFDIIGLAAGADTVSVTGAGFRGDSAIAVVEPGALVLVGTPAQTVTVGDSVFIVVQLRSNDGGSVAITTPQTMLFATDSLFAVSDGATTVTQIPLEAGNTGIGFWLRAREAGTSEVVISSANYRSLRLAFTARTGVAQGGLVDATPPPPFRD